MARKNIPSTYDPALLSDDIREFKRLLRQTPGLSQTIRSARRIDEASAELIIGAGSARQHVLFSLVDGEWSMTVGSEYWRI
jgi:hypothetical protein